MRLCRNLICLLAVPVIAGFVVTLMPAPEAAGQGRDRRQNAEQAREAEDNLDQMLRRFGPQYDGLAPRIDAAINKGVDWLLSKQAADGHWDCYNNGPTSYPMGGTAFCALAIKKSMKGMYEGDEKDLDKEIKKLERKEKSGRIEWEEQVHLNYLRDKARGEIERREKMQASVDKALQWIRAKYAEIKNAGQTQLPDGTTGAAYRTYDLGIILMLLEGYYTAKKETRDGYVFDVDEKKIPKGDLDWIREMVSYLERFTIQPNYNGKTHPGVGWRYPGPAGDGSSVDNSNSQYAVLGLKAASRMGVHMSKSQLWLDVVRYFMSIQEADGPVIPRKPPAMNPGDGKYFFPPAYTEPQPNDRARGWGYLAELDPHHPVTGAMTTAALAAMTLARSELIQAGLLKNDPDMASKIDQSIADGMAWMGKYFSVTTNPTANAGSRMGWHYYYLYGLERAGVLCQSEYFGTHPWYPEGAKLICDQQKPDGHWDANSSPAHPGANTEGNVIADTCFAVLFLKRATTPVKAPPIVRPVITGND